MRTRSFLIGLTLLAVGVIPAVHHHPLIASPGDSQVVAQQSFCVVCLNGSAVLASAPTVLVAVLLVGFIPAPTLRAAPKLRAGIVSTRAPPVQA